MEETKKDISLMYDLISKDLSRLATDFKVLSDYLLTEYREELCKNGASGNVEEKLQ